MSLLHIWNGIESLFQVNMGFVRLIKIVLIHVKGISFIFYGEILRRLPSGVKLVTENSIIYLLLNNLGGNEFNLADHNTDLATLM